MVVETCGGNKVEVMVKEEVAISGDSEIVMVKVG